MICNLKLTIISLLVFMIFSTVPSIAIETKPPIPDPKPEPLGDADGGSAAFRSLAPLIQKRWRSFENEVQGVCSLIEEDDCICAEDCECE